jgi:Uma2 family endonuclease
MATEAKRERRSGRRDLGRTIYRLTGEQALKMRELGIIGPDEDVELWNGVLYKMTKYEPHNFAVMCTAELLRPLIPPDYHVREEKSSAERVHYLPEPDIGIARGGMRSYVHSLPALDRFALVVEVCASTPRADYKQKPPVYARAGIPVYWVIDLQKREIVVFGEPRDLGEQYGYATQTRYTSGQTVDVVIDGQVRGRIAVDDVLPPESPAEDTR